MLLDYPSWNGIDDEWGKPEGICDCGRQLAHNNLTGVCYLCRQKAKAFEANAVCQIFGSEIDFKKTVLAENVKAVCQDIWDNVDKYTDYHKTSADGYYRFLKFLWVEYPNGTTKRLTDIVDM